MAHRRLVLGRLGISIWVSPLPSLVAKRGPAGSPRPNGGRRPRKAGSLGYIETYLGSWPGLVLTPSAFTLRYRVTKGYQTEHRFVVVNEQCRHEQGCRQDDLKLPHTVWGRLVSIIAITKRS